MSGAWLTAGVAGQGAGGGAGDRAAVGDAGHPGLPGVGVASPVPTRAPPIITWLPEIGGDLAARGDDVGLRGFQRGRPGAAIGAGIGVAHLRDADHAGLADVTAEIQGFRVGVGVGEVGIGLPGEEAAEGAVGIAQPRDQIIRDAGGAGPAAPPEKLLVPAQSNSMKVRASP